MRKNNTICELRVVYRYDNGQKYSDYFLCNMAKMETVEKLTSGEDDVNNL